ncbi:MAG: OmpA family protein [Flavobacteriales bacterium]|nr:OmpA family protein [Flavobacteriales bacterium]
MKTKQFQSLLFVLTLISIPQLTFTQQKATVNVTVTDFDNIPLKGEQILFVDQNDQSTLKGISNKEGKFSIELSGGSTYDIKIKSVGEAQDYNTLEIPTIGPNESYGEAIMQVMIEQPTQFTLNNVFFDTGKSSLKSTSYKELDELVDLLKLQPDLKIEIAGHTDNVGSDESNKTLSEERAKAVLDYLVQEGIDKNRLTSNGYGSSIPVADNTTESGRKKNRRTEIHILS